LAVELTGSTGPFGNESALEKVFGLLYTAGFRMTGDHREAAGLVKRTISAAGVEENLYPVLKVMLRQYAGEGATARDRMTPAGGRPSGQSRRDLLIQGALLQLPAGERLVVVLRDVLGLSYAEVGEVAGLDEPMVARMLAAGRRRLAEQLIPHIKQAGCLKEDYCGE